MVVGLPGTHHPAAPLPSEAIGRPFSRGYQSHLSVLPPLAHEAILPPETGSCGVLGV